MHHQDFIAALPQALAASDALATELGVFFAHVFPGCDAQNPRTGEAVTVPARRVPFFVPSDRLLERIAAKESFGSSDYRSYLAQRSIGELDLTSGEPTSRDPNDFKEPILLPPSTRSFEAGDLFAEAAAALASKGQFKLSGFGVLRRKRVARGRMKGRVVLTFQPSPVLTSILNERPG